MRQRTIEQLQRDVIAIAEKNKYNRHYSMVDLILLFFAFSFAGWLWEVIFRLVVDRHLANGGVLYGPWLPIYGFGCLVALVLLHGVAEKPLLLFVWSCLFCSLIEYGTGWFLEWKVGLRWWDYSNVPFNLNGYICLPVSLVFGMGCVAVVYSLAPRLTDLFHHFPPAVRTVIAAVLILLFLWDVLYVQWHPNIQADLVKSMPMQT